MNEKKHIKKQKYVAVRMLLLMIFALYYVGLVYEQHLHFQEGRLVIHSHPSSSSDHSHTEGDFQLIYKLTHFSALPTEYFPELIADFFLIKVFTEKRENPFIKSLRQDVISLRAPPAC